MKLRLTILVTFTVLACFLISGTVVWADSSKAKSNKSIQAARDGKDPLGRKNVAEISKDKADKEQKAREKQKRTKKNIAELDSAENNRYGLTPVEKQLAKQLPYEVRARLKNIPKDRRLDWLVTRVVEQKPEWVKNFLIKKNGEAFSKQWEKRAVEDQPNVLKLLLNAEALRISKNLQSQDGKRVQGNKPAIEKGKNKVKPQIRRKEKRMLMRENRDGKMINRGLQQMNNQKRGMMGRGLQGMGNQKRGMMDQGQLKNLLSPEERKKFKNLPPEKKVDFLVERIIEKRGSQIEKRLKNNPEFKKKLEGMSPEDRKAAIKKALKKRIANKMKKMKGQRQGMMGNGMQMMGKNRQGMNQPGMMQQPMKQGKGKMGNMRQRMGNMGPGFLEQYPSPKMPPPPFFGQGFGEQGKGKGMPFMDPMMRENMIKFMMGHPDMVREIIRSFPPELKQMLRKMLNEDLGGNKKNKEKIIRKEPLRKEQKETGEKEKPEKEKTQE